MDAAIAGPRLRLRVTPAGGRIGPCAPDAYPEATLSRAPDRQAAAAPALSRAGAEPTRKVPGRSQREGRATARGVDRAALGLAYETGASAVDLALAHGLSRATIHELLREAGCRLRTPAQARRAQEKHSYLRRPRPERAEGHAPVRDVEGALWRVTHLDGTEHGFAVLHGRRIGGRGGRAVILTAALAAHLEAHRLSPRLVALPLGQSALVRLRRRLGLNWAEDNRAWWEERRADLEGLAPEVFAARHGVVEGTAMVMRRRLGRKSNFIPRV